MGGPRYLPQRIIPTQPPPPLPQSIRYPGQLLLHSSPARQLPPFYSMLAHASAGLRRCWPAEGSWEGLLTGCAKRC